MVGDLIMQFKTTCILLPVVSFTKIGTLHKSYDAKSEKAVIFILKNLKLYKWTIRKSNYNTYIFFYCIIKWYVES